MYAYERQTVSDPWYCRNYTPVKEWREGGERKRLERGEREKEKRA